MEEPKMTKPLRPALLLAATAATGLALSGCKLDNRPLLARGDPAPDAYATPAPAPGPLEPVSAVAAGQPCNCLAPAQAYVYPARARRVSRAYYDAPPAYGFDYGGEQPWVWAAADDDLMFAEPYDDGYRYYYYEAGWDYPYFVQDDGYGYAFDDSGALVALFDAAGVLLSGDGYSDYYRRAHDDWSRGFALERAYRASPRFVVDRAVWRERAPQLAQGRERWFAAAAAQPAWREAAPRGDWSLPRGVHGAAWSGGHGAGARIAEAGRVIEPGRVAAPDRRGPQILRGGERTAALEPRRGFEAHAAARMQAGPRHGERLAQQAWHGGGGRQGGPAAFAQRGPAHGGGGEARTRMAFAQHGPPRGGGETPARVAFAQHGAPHGGGGGPRMAFAPSAGQHGHEASFRGPAQPQGHPGGGGGNHGGGGHGGGNRGGGDGDPRHH
jgi:hypothetical protein